MNDITTPDDVHRMVHSFYGKVREDELLGPVFNDVACVDWGHHLPIMVTFWESLLLKTDRYRRNALLPHLEVFRKVSFDPRLMDRWLMLFDETVDSLFAGEVADKAKHWAKGIGRNLTRQILHQSEQMGGSAINT